MRDALLVAVCLLGLSACGGPDERFAQVSMTPMPSGYTPGAMETAAKPTPADSPTPPPRR